MPRINTLDPYKRKVERLMDYIKGQMHRLRITQKDLAREMGVSQQTISNKFKNNSFTIRELMWLLDYLKATKEEVGELMTL